MKAMLGQIILLGVLCLPGVDRPPLTISASNAGGWGDVEWWFIDVRADGTAEVTPRSTLQPLVLDTAAMDELRGLIEGGRLFELADEYGSFGIESSFCKLSFELGERRKTIALGNLIGASDEERADAAKVRKVWRKLKALVRVSDREDACLFP